MKRYAWAAAIGLTLLIVGYLTVRYVLGYVLPFTLALVLAVLIDPMVGHVQRVTRLPRAAAVGFSLVIVLGGLGGVMFFATSQLMRELLVLSREFPSYYSDAATMVRSAVEGFGRLQQSLPEPVRSALQNQETELLSLLLLWLRKALDAVLSVFRGLPSLLVIVVVSCIATFFISRDKQVVSAAWWQLVPQPWHQRLSMAKSDLMRSMLGFLWAQIILVMVTAVLTTVGFAIIGGSYAVTLGLVVGILDLVPYLGPSVVILPWATVVTLRGDWVMGLKLMTILASVALVRQYLEVRLVGERTGMHPLVILLSLYVGIKLFGPVGFLLGPLVAIVGKSALVSGLLSWPGSDDGGSSCEAGRDPGCNRIDRTTDARGDRGRQRSV